MAEGEDAEFGDDAWHEEDADEADSESDEESEFEEDDWDEEDHDWYADEMTAGDCLSIEKFDARYGMCFLECSTTEECDALEATVQDEIDAKYGEYDDIDEDEEGDQ